MIGIYSFTNLMNNKKYIGQSTNLEKRRKEHLYGYLNIKSNSYNSLFYRAIRKYGIENFKYEIIFSSNILNSNSLNFLETYFIKKYNSYENGYNMNIGGRFTSGNKTLTEQKVKEIQFKILSTKESFTSIAKQYGVTVSSITHINNGNTWTQVSSYNYPLRDNCYQNNMGTNNPNAKLSDEIVVKLRNSFTSLSLTELYEKNKNICSFSSFKKAVYGVSFIHLPVYKKREKKWFLNGTCIDYPRLEE